MKPEPKWDPRRLVDVAMGRAPADLVIRDGRWVCVQSGELVRGTDVAVKDERVAYVGPDARHTVGPSTRLLDAADSYLVPGLLDAHMHVEMAMVTLTAFVRAATPHGTTGIFIDPHELVNVCGLDGLRWISDEATVQPIHVWLQVPSCVPSAPGLENAGATIGSDQVAEAIQWTGVIGLGEMMSYPQVIDGVAAVLEKMAIVRRAGRIIGGHYASPDLGRPFHGYVAAGPEDDHEGRTLEDAIARVRQGLKTMLRLGAGIDDLSAQIRAITERKLDARHFLLASDGVTPDILSAEGHMNRAIRRAIQEGLPPIKAVQMATINTAEHFGVSRDVGQIAPGRFADILLVSDLTDLTIETVIARGQIIVQDGSMVDLAPAFTYPQQAVNLIRIGRKLGPADFAVRAPSEGPIKINVIGMQAGEIQTQHRVVEVRSEAGEIRIDLERDLAKVAVIERHRASGAIQVGFVQGFGIRWPGAFASTVAHDSHNLVMVGTDEISMALAANELSRMQGGQIVVARGQVVARLPLPIAGLMSEAPVEQVADDMNSLAAALVGELGCRFPGAMVQLTRLPLVVIPELRISDLGLVDVNRSQIISLQEAE